jgi:hypothetical protein
LLHQDVAGDKLSEDRLYMIEILLTDSGAQFSIFSNYGL